MTSEEVNDNRDLFQHALSGTSACYRSLCYMHVMSLLIMSRAFDCTNVPVSLLLLRQGNH